MFYFISYTLFNVLNTPFRYKQTSFAHFAAVAKSGPFWLNIVTSSQLSVTSREREALALWRHFRRLFLHVQIDTKAMIFTSE